MGKKHNMLLCANISFPYNQDFICREEGDWFEQRTNRKLHRMVETWAPEMWETPCQSTGSLVQVADLFDSFYSATFLAWLSVYALGYSSCIVKLYRRRAAANMLH